MATNNHETKWGIPVTLLITVLIVWGYARFTDEEEVKVVEEPVEAVHEVVDVDWGEPIELPKQTLELNRQTNYAMVGDIGLDAITQSGHKPKEWQGVWEYDTVFYNFPLYGFSRMNEMFYLDEEFGPLNVIGFSTDKKIDWSLIGSVVEIEYNDGEKRNAIILDNCGGCHISYNEEKEIRIDLFTYEYDADAYDLGYVRNGIDNLDGTITFIRKGWK